MEKLISLYDEIAIVFSSPESFERYYERELNKVQLSTWKEVLERKLFEIHHFLKGVMVENVRPETVDIWINKISGLLKNVDSIKWRIKNELDCHIAYADLPEAIFLPDTIQDDMNRTGKTYEQLEHGYLLLIKERTEVLQGIKLYIDTSYSVISFALNKMAELQPSKIVGSNTALKMANKAEFAKKGNGLINEVNSEAIESFEISKAWLINRLYIALTTPPSFIKKINGKDFEMAFSAKPSDVIIDWIANKNQLSYFLRRLKEEGIILNSRHWEVAAKYFTVKGELLKADLLKTNDSIAGKPKRMIDDLISKIKPD